VLSTNETFRLFLDFLNLRSYLVVTYKKLLYTFITVYYYLHNLTTRSI